MQPSDKHRKRKASFKYTLLGGGGDAKLHMVLALDKKKYAKYDPSDYG